MYRRVDHVTDQAASCDPHTTTTSTAQPLTTTHHTTTHHHHHHHHHETTRIEASLEMEKQVRGVY